MTVFSRFFNFLVQFLILALLGFEKSHSKVQKPLKNSHLNSAKCQIGVEKKASRWENACIFSRVGNSYSNLDCTLKFKLRLLHMGQEHTVNVTGNILGPTQDLLDCSSQNCRFGAVSNSRQQKYWLNKPSFLYFPRLKYYGLEFVLVLYMTRKNVHWYLRKTRLAYRSESN